MEWVVSLALGAITIVSLVLVGLTLVQKGRDSAALAFSIILIAAAGWSGGIAVFYSVEYSLLIADIAVRTYYIAAALIALAILYLALALARRTQQIGRASFYPLLSLPFIALVAVFLFIPEVFFHQVQPGHVVLNIAGYLAYVVYFIVYYGLALLLLAFSMKRARGVERSRLKYLLVGYAAGGTIGMTFNLILPVFGNYEYIWAGPLGLFVFVPIVYVIIVKYGLFDIRHTAARTMAYISTLAIVAVIYAFLATYLSTLIVGNVFAQTILVLIAALTFQPVKVFFDRITEAVFYKNTYNADEFYARFNEELTSTTDLRALLRRTSTLIQKTLKSSQTFLIVHTAGSRFISAGTERHVRLAAADVELLSEQTGDIIAVDSLEVPLAVRKMLSGYRISLVMILRSGDDTLGFLCLGEHLASRYSTRDFKVLSTISDSLGIAIQNALSVHEVKELNDTLQQRIDNATSELRRSNAQLQRLDEIKDEFISMASHQLRTPLTSIKGYLSMLIEGDLGAVTKEQKHVLSEAFVSSERMVRLIGDFLNVSRLQTGKFVIEKRPVDLADLVQRELDALESNAAARGMKFAYKKPKGLPLIEFDENKVEQVIMNFADNAIYYAKENSTIKVTVKKVDGFAEFTVQDNGIGVPKEDQPRLFTKFYRASNARKARPDGTGVGLFLAKKVIDSHDGSIIFQSEEGKGSTFGFRLPLPPSAS